MTRSARRRKTREDEDQRDGTPSPIAGPMNQLEATDRLIQQSGGDPERLAERLDSADTGSQTRALERLQQGHGNRFVLDVVGAMARGRRGVFSGAGAGSGHLATIDIRHSAGRPGSESKIQRDDDESALEEAQAAGGATETIGPPAQSTYGLAAVSLADVAAQISARDEAGDVRWVTNMSFSAPKGLIDTVSVSAAISVELPSWTPPSTMLPKAKAEWTRWYGALLAHEQGHVDLIHAAFDGLAASMLDSTAAQGKAMFQGAKTKLANDSRSYDATTDHGRNTGTVMDVSIEEKETEEERRKKDGAGSANKKESTGAAP